MILCESGGMGADGENLNAKFLSYKEMIVIIWDLTMNVGVNKNMKF